MNNTPLKLRKQLADDPYYKECARKELFDDHICEPDPLTGKLIEWEHAIYFKGRQLQERWAIVPICWLVHRGGMLNKEINELLALMSADKNELKAISKVVNYENRLNFLVKKYGV